MVKISVIMGAYNCESTLQESIDSIMTQTFQDFNIIICDDGSVDNTATLLINLENKHPNKFKVLFNDENMGLNYTLNKCLKYVDGEYVARMDADDVSLPERFELQNNFLDSHSEYDFVSSNMVHFDETGDWGISKTVSKPKKKDIIKNSPFPHAPVMIRRKAYEAVNGYSESKHLLRVEDYHLWVKLYSEGFQGFNIAQPLYKMRDDHNAYKRRSWNNRINGMRVRIYAIKVLKLPLWNYIYVVRPILVGILPRQIYEKLHKMRLKDNSI